jgi:mono/diheme cytochrome c family protein
MKRMSALTLFAAMLALAASQVPGLAQAPSHEGHGVSSVSQATFNKDVLPILQKNCQVCHRPGEVAPMSLMTYQDARPWAKAMKTATTSGKMPPWSVEPEYDHHFSNVARLTPAEIGAIASWADNSAPEGNASDRPAPVSFRDGWNLKPDLVIEMPTEFQVQATGAIEYQYMLVKGDFKEDVWIREAEMRAGNSRVVHHGEVWVVPPGSRWMKNAVPGVSYAASKMPKDPTDGIDIIGKFNPGLGAQTFDFGGSAKFIPKGSDLVFEIHYTAIGKETTDRTKVGFVVAKGPHTTRYYTSYGPTARNLVISARDDNSEVVGEVTVANEATLVYAQPHMHLRGKDYELRAIFPNGESQTLFRSKFDFNWQLGYNFAKPVVLTKGTRLLGISHFDNSPANRFNPDPTKEIRWGLQNWDEMSNCFLGLVFDAKTDPKSVFVFSGPSLLPVGPPGPTLAMVKLQ